VGNQPCSSSRRRLWTSHTLTGEHPDYYDTDQGNKSSMARDIARSVRRYAIVQSNVPRFQGKMEYRAPAVTYDLDHLHKRTVASTSLRACPCPPSRKPGRRMRQQNASISLPETSRRLSYCCSSAP
jgi:hypothetical protein